MAVRQGQPAEPHQRDPVRQEHRRDQGLNRPAQAPARTSDRVDLHVKGTAGHQRRDAAQRPGSPDPAGTPSGSTASSTTPPPWRGPRSSSPDAFTILEPRSTSAPATIDRHRPEEGLTTDPGPAGSHPVRPCRPRNTRSPSTNWGLRVRSHHRRQAQLVGAPMVQATIQGSEQR